MLRQLRVAIGFLTILPVSPREFRRDDLGRAVPFFPLVGVIYATLTWGLLQIFNKFLPNEIVAWLVVLAMVLLNGGIHWDGWADTADGLGGHTPEKSLAIMKDSRLGAFGGMALVFLLLGKVLLLSQLTQESWLIFVGIAVWSRWTMVYLLYTQPSVSRGLLTLFQLESAWYGLSISTILALLLTIWLGSLLVVFLSSSVIGLTIVILIIRKKFGGITGDLLGATNELVELLALLLCLIFV